MEKACYRLIEAVNDHTDRVWNLAWNASGTMLASCSSDKSIKIWKFNPEGHLLQMFSSLKSKDHQRSIRSVSFAPKNKDNHHELLASCGFDGKSLIWRLQNKETQFQQEMVIEGHENEVKSIAWNYIPANDTYLLATCGRDKSIWIWEIYNDLSSDCISVLQDHTQDVKCVVWHPSGKILASSSADDTIRLWKEDLEESEWVCYKTLEGHHNIVWSIDFDLHGDYLLSGSEDHSFKIWAKDTNWNCIYTVSNQFSRPIYSVHWSKTNSNMLAVAGGDDSIFIYKWDTDTRGPVLVFKIENAHKGDINSIQWHPIHNRIIASCGDNCLVKLWSIQQPTERINSTEV